MPDKKAASTTLMPISQIQAQEAQWLWPGRIRKGIVTALVGRAKTGKSLIACELAARVSTGGQFPAGEGEAQRGQVLIINAEDDAAQVLRPRLEAALADLTRIHIPTDRGPLLVRELRGLVQKISHLRLVILDPITALFPINRNNADHVRAVLTELGTIAAEHQIAILLVVHLNKSKTGTAGARVSGSFEWMAACRASFLVAEEAGTNRHLFLPMPNNVGLKGEGLAFEITEVNTESGAAPSVWWLEEMVTMSADEALAGRPDSATTSEAAEFLLQTVTKPIPAKEVLRLGKAAGFSTKELRTAREKLKFRTKRVGKLGSEGHWTWFPPAK
jgi:putative DNA primase/helicase